MYEAKVNPSSIFVKKVRGQQSADDPQPERNSRAARGNGSWGNLQNVHLENCLPTSVPPRVADKWPCAAHTLLDSVGRRLARDRFLTATESAP